MKTILFTQSDNIELMVENGNPMGGAVVETLVWMRSLHDLGFRILQFREEGDTRKILPEFDWVEIVPIFNSSKGIKWFRWIFYRFPKTWFAIKKTKPVYVYESIPSWTSYFILKMCHTVGTKFILRIANDNMLDDRLSITHSMFDKFFIYKSLKASDFILPQNSYQLKRLKILFPNIKLLLLQNPYIINHNYLKSKKSKSGFIVWVANFRYQKNLKLLFEIASKLTEEEIKIAGKPVKNIDDESKEYLDKLEKLPNIEFLGTVSRERILDIFCNAKFLLNTSRYEGFSNTFLEAMSTGTPILTTSAVNPDGIIDYFNLGYVYKSPEDLINYLENLDEFNYKQLSLNAIKYICINHDHLKIGKRLVEFLENEN